MKFAVYLAALTLTATLGTAYASDTASPEDDIAGYCKNQAELAGVEDMSEKSQYIQDCVESFGPADDAQLPTE